MTGINISFDEDDLNLKIKKYVEAKVGKEIYTYLDKNALLPFIRAIVKEEVRNEVNNLNKKILNRKQIYNIITQFELQTKKTQNKKAVK